MQPHFREVICFHLSRLCCDLLCAVLCFCSRVSKTLLAGLWADHGGSADGLNLIAMALGLPVKEVRGLGV